nr:NTP transferase domain-containing protein [Bradyrhizobium sp. IAR9]
MKAVILAGGLGPPAPRESNLRPKLMIEIGGNPILWHILKVYSSQYGINDFVVCCGYKGYQITEHLADYFLQVSDVTLRHDEEPHAGHQHHAALVYVGEKIMNYGRLKRVANCPRDEDGFFFTYGNDVGHIDVAASMVFHRGQDALPTLAATHPELLSIRLIDSALSQFVSPPSGTTQGQMGIINVGFVVHPPKVIDLLLASSTPWKREPIARLAEQQQLAAYHGFRQATDTLCEKTLVLESLWV